MFMVLFLIVAAQWWSSHIMAISRLKAAAFKAALIVELKQKYHHHWSTDYPLRGSGYRAIIYDTVRVDPCLVSAAIAAKLTLDDLHNAFKRVIDHTMFVNPGEVKVRNAALLTSNSIILWPESSKNDTQSSPSMNTLPMFATPSKSSLGSTAQNAAPFTPQYQYKEDYERHKTPRK